MTRPASDIYSPSEFIHSVVKESKAGCGFLPLVAAGLSAPSGIPVTKELEGYLQRCIALALGINNPDCWSPRHRNRSKDYFEFIRWLPGRDQWPPFGGPQIIGRNSIDWQARLLHVVRMFSETESSYKELQVFQEAFGAMAEWRSSLNFLSRLRLRPNDNTLQLAAEDPDIIDTFFLNVILGKRPTLGHRLLARLSAPMRISHVLTINFDDLIEQAFDEINRPLTQFDVHVDSGLPSYHDMIGKNCVVKLHGGRYGLRADYSLDAPPGESDCRHFVEYLLNRAISEEEWSRAGSHRWRVQRHLFVIGCGANDERVLRFIQVAYKKTEGLKVYWTAFSKSGAEKAKQVLKPLARAGRKSQAIVVAHHFLGLLFLQMYQDLTHSLPPSGLIFPYAPRLPVPPEWGSDSENPLSHNSPSNNQRRSSRRAPTIEDFIEEVNSRISDCCRGNVPDSNNRFILCTSADGTLNGTTTALSRVFHEQLERKRQAVWIDLDESTDTDNFFENLIHAVSRKAGIVDWLPVLVDKQDVLPPSDEQTRRDHAEAIRHLQIREISRLTNNPNRDWIVFVNARTGAGKNLPSRPNSPVMNSPNGWLDMDKPADGTGEVATGPYFLELINRLSGKECPNVTIVLLCYNGPFVTFCNDHLPERRCTRRPQFPTNSGIKKTVPQIVKESLKWANDDAKKRFLFSLCLANRPRFPAILWSRVFHGDAESQGRFDSTQDWLKDLAKRHVIRTKLGGFTWMHCEIRDSIRNELRKKKRMQSIEPELQQGLCEAYWRLFLTSDDAMAAFEAIYHHFRRIVTSISLDAGDESSLVPQWLAQVLHLLQLARPAMLSVGFSKGVCRWLAYIRDHLVAEVGSTLTSTTAEISRLLKTIAIETVRLQRDIAREVGENAIAAKRHRELRARICDRMGRVSYEVIKEYIHRPEREVLADKTTVGKLLRQLMLPHESGIWRSVHWADDGEVEPIVEWIDSETQIATLGIAARSYEFGEKRFGRIYSRLRLDSREMDAGEDRASIERCNLWLSDWRSRKFNVVEGELENDRYQIVFGVTKALGRDLQMRLAWGQLALLCERRGLTSRVQAESQFAMADRRYKWAIESMNLVHQEAEREKWAPFGYHHRREDLRGWYDERQRLDTQHSVVLAYRNDFDKAHRRLNEAEAALRRATAARLPTEQAIIELHRAEVFTIQACRTPDGKDSHLTVLRGKMIKQSQPMPHAANDDRFEALRSSHAYLEDAWNALDRAGRLLDRERKNVWWTTWYFDLRMKLIELFAFDSVVQGRDTVPHLGLEAVPLKFPTFADELLDSSRRMVRLDVFRFAHTVESYAHALLALRLWRRQLDMSGDSSKRAVADAHLRRQHHMSQMLTGPLPQTEETSVRVIERLMRERDQYDQAWPTTMLDSLTKQYVTFVLQKVSRIQRQVGGR